MVSWASQAKPEKGRSGPHWASAAVSVGTAHGEWALCGRFGGPLGPSLEERVIKGLRGLWARGAGASGIVSSVYLFAWGPLGRVAHNGGTSTRGPAGVSGAWG